LELGDRICPKCQQIFAGDITVCPNDNGKLMIVRKSEDDRVGQLIDGKYTVLGLLGAGGMGTVYRALQHSMERAVAIKLLRRALSEDITQVKRFLQEAKGLSGLNHPNVITLFDFGQTDEGELYLVMELLEGEPLSDILDRSGRMETTRAVSIISQVLDALYAAHDHGVIHRDLKPDNIFVVKGAGRMGEFVKVLDFGIAKMNTLGAEDSITRTGNVCGTPQYMSPEQAMGDDVDARSDIYAVAIVLYEMLTGKPPFDGDTAMKVMLQQVNDMPPLLAEMSPPVHVPPQLETALRQGMAKEASERPTSGTQFKELLLDSISEGDTLPEGAGAVEKYGATKEQLVKALAHTQGIPISAETGTLAQVAKEKPRSRAPWIVAGIAVVAALAIAVWAVLRPPVADPGTTKPLAEEPIAAVDTTPAPAPPVERAPVAKKAQPAEPAPAPKPPTASVVLLPRRDCEQAGVSAPRMPIEVTATAPTPLKIRVLSRPQGATVLADGQLVGKTPLEIDRPPEGTTVMLIISLRGHRAYRQAVTHDASGDLEVRLKRTRTTKKPPKPKGPVLVE